MSQKFTQDSENDVAVRSIHHMAEIPAVAVLLPNITWTICTIDEDRRCVAVLR
jgi:hypothetical protein